MIALDPGQHVVGVLGSVVQRQADKPCVLFRLVSQQANALFLGAVELLQTRDDFPDIWAARECRPAVVGGSAEDDPWVIPLLDALDD